MRTSNPSLSKLLRGSRILVALLCFGGAGFDHSALAAALPAQTASKQVIGSASAESVRFVFLGELIQIRLEVIGSSGEHLWDSGFKSGNVIDWPLSDKPGQRLPDGSYLCVVTVKDSSGATIRKHAIASVHDQAVTLRQSDSSLLTSAQAEAAGSVSREDVSLIILEPAASTATAVLAHDGSATHLVSGSGGFSISSGDFFANKLLEHMRLTAEGNLGIGTSNPQARLDVAGSIRASEGIVFPDGTIQFSAASKTLGARSTTAGQKLGDKHTFETEAAGTGTQGQLAKWTDNSGTLGNSIITETTGGFLGIGTSGPDSLLNVRGTIPVPLGHMAAIRSTGSNNGFGLLMDAIGSGNNAVGLAVNGAPKGGFSWDNTRNFIGLVNFTYSSNDFSLRVNGNGSLTFHDGATSAERFRVTAAGNVGIGTSVPAALLDVAGNINTSTQYNIGGSPVLSAPGTANLFAGMNAGASNTSGGDNSFFGSLAGRNNTTGGVNSFFGFSAGAANTSGLSNSFFGALAGQSNTSGPNNAFFGYAAGSSNTDATGNAFFGAFAGQKNTASNNAFFGLSAGKLNTTGGSNSFFGSLAGASNTDGGSNAFFGTLAGVANTTGSTNSFFGTVAGQSNTIGARNAFFGFAAGSNGTTATDNSFFGSQAGQNNAASFNSFFGASVGLVNTTGGANAFFGAGAGLNNTTGSSNSFFGRLAGNANTEGFNNTFTGSLAGQNNTTGQQNTFVGYAAGLSNTTATGNSFFGESAGRFNTTASHNSFFGFEAGKLNTEGTDNSFFGYQAGQSFSFGILYGNSFFGSKSGANTTGDGNSFFGQESGKSNRDGYRNAFFGAFAGLESEQGNDNSFFGFNAGWRNTTGNSNAFVGFEVGDNNTSGGNNTFFGYHAGDSNATGDDNTIIGSSADVGSSNLSFATAVGAGAIVNSSNTIVLGRSDGSDFVRIPGLLTIPNLAAAGMTQLCRNSFDRVGDCSSSLRYKTNLAPYRSGLSIVNRLRPISFTWKEGGMRDLGFGAEDVEKIDPLLVTYNKQGQVEGVKYDRINVVLVNAIKEQQRQIEELKVIKAENAALKAQLADIWARLEQVEKKKAEQK